MKTLIKILLFFLIILINGNSCKKKEIQETDLKIYLDNNWKSPENYIIDKFDNYDYVFIGEYHRIKHDVELIKDLIPRLYKKGIYNLGFEFGNYQYQHLSDCLLNLTHFDRKLARKIMFKSLPTWNYKEYIDIYETAWVVNHSEHSDNNKTFRIINLSADYDPCKEGGAWKDIDPDVFMGNVILNEIVNKNEKALIYSGIHHAFTKYKFPIYDEQIDSLEGYGIRMGNIVYDKVKDKSFTIFLHSPWPSAKDYNKTVLPVEGIIDSLMKQYDNKRVGFDVIKSPFGKLTSPNSYYKYGQSNFTLDKFCDGYIYQKELKNYQPMTIEKNFFTENNLQELKDFLLCLGRNKERINNLTVESANKTIKEDIRLHFKHLIK